MRYGGRTDADAEDYLTKKSLLRVMQQATILHQRGDVQPADVYDPVPTEVQTPADIPPMKAMIGRRKESCIHCHDVKLARLKHLRSQGKLEKEMVFTYPPPQQSRTALDRDIQYKVQRVERGSPAAAAGIRPGDLIRKAEGHRVLTYGDLTRVLELAPETGSLSIDIERQQQPVAAKVRLAEVGGSQPIRRGGSRWESWGQAVDSGEFPPPTSNEDNYGSARMTWRSASISFMPARQAIGESVTATI